MKQKNHNENKELCQECGKAVPVRRGLVALWCPACGAVTPYKPSKQEMH